MSGYIKYFQKGAESMYFMIGNDSLLIKYNEIWNKIKKTLGIKFHSMPFYNEKYTKTKIKEFNDVVNTNFLDDGVPERGVHYTCLACFGVDSATKKEKKNYRQVYLGQCKYKVKKITEFIDVELESGFNLDCE